MHTKVNKLDNTVEELQNRMNSINEWSSQNNLMFNTKKTKLMLFSTSQILRARKLKEKKKL